MRERVNGPKVNEFSHIGIKVDRLYVPSLGTMQMGGLLKPTCSFYFGPTVRSRMDIWMDMQVGLTTVDDQPTAQMKNLFHTSHQSRGCRVRLTQVSCPTTTYPLEVTQPPHL